MEPELFSSELTLYFAPTIASECVYLINVQEMLAMSLACMELQLEQWLHNKGKTGKYQWANPHHF